MEGRFLKQKNGIYNKKTVFIYKKGYFKCVKRVNMKMFCF